MKFLDYAGLSLFWNRAKAYIDSAVAALRSSLAADIGAVAAADRVNLLTGTNRGKEGWSATYASGYEVRLSGTSDSRELRAENRAEVDVPAGAYQTIFRPLPAGLFAKDEDYVLSFEAYATRERGSGPLVLNVAVGDAASTRTLADSGWFYVETGGGYARYTVRLKGLAAGSVTKASDMLKIAFVAGQNPGWLELYIRDMKLERGTAATGYTPAPADLTESLEERVAALTEAVLKLAEARDRQGATVCVLHDVVSSISQAQTPTTALSGRLVLSTGDMAVYRCQSNALRQMEWAVCDRWMDTEEGSCRDDVLYFYEGAFYNWVQDGAELVQEPTWMYWPSFTVPGISAASAAAVSEEEEAPEG